VKASESIELSGTSVSGITPSGISAFSSGSGNAASGDVKLTTGELIVRDGAEVTVRGESSGPAGDLEVTADSIFLENQGKLTASTASGEGGNISLEVQDSIRLRSNSEISAQAGGTGNGGNITMNVGNFIIAILSENSDIVANAFEGPGGRIDATAQRIFGFRQFLKRRTPESDFTASSEFGIDGVVEINTPLVDPSQGVTELPTDLVDPSSLVDRSCRPGAGSALNSSFTVTGRGGLPTNPGDALGEEGLLEDLGTPVAARDEEQGGISAALASPSSPPARIVEAQGWVKRPDGTVILTAQAPNGTSQTPQFSSPACQDVQAIADE
jgi:large exoprotein involved in heme utilization and adhesion